MKYIRLFKKHSKECRVKDGPSPWSGIIKRSFFGNCAANEAGHGHHHWLIVSCNDPSCDGLCAIHSKVLKDIASHELEVLKQPDYNKQQFEVYPI